MLFNSYTFIIIFLPLSLFLYYIFGKYSSQLSLSILLAFSILFYSWFEPFFLLYLFGSVGINYLFCKIILIKNIKHSFKRLALTIGISVNLLTLFYFKYFTFFLENFNNLNIHKFHIQAIILPLGISFITFQKIALLVDVFKGNIKDFKLFDVLLFSFFFPPLISGPILHFREAYPQFKKEKIERLNINNLAVGISIFSIGLFKKVIIADNLALIADPIFAKASTGLTPDILAAWIGALAYSFQIYFDFSAYSEMAVGLGRMFNITLPLNFYSPYKSTNISSFWRSWHISLSRFFRDYLYFPLGGNRKGYIYKHKNLLTTMVLCGLWHGASWNFALWGLLHGIALIINDLWLLFKKQFFENYFTVKRLYLNYFLTTISIFITFIFVTCTWVIFRTTNFSSAYTFLLSMYGKGSAINFSVPKDELIYILIVLGVATTIVFSFPSVYDMFSKNKPFLLDSKFKEENNIILIKVKWAANFLWVSFICFILFISFINMGRHSPFIYFQF